MQFDDPNLKDAIQRAWGDESAPQRLRGRISRLIATAGSIDAAAVAGSGTPSPGQRWQGRLYAFAAAAVVVLGIGLLVLYYHGAFDTSSRLYANVPQFIAPSKTQVPITLASSLIATHNACGKLHDHRLVQGVDSYGALNVKLTADLGFPSLARSIGEDWKFRGAGECTVGNLRGSHLMFTRGDQVVSVFSLPATCMSGVIPGAQYEGIVEGQPVAGFARPGAVYAVVGSSAGSSLPLETITAIRDGLFSQFDEGCSEPMPQPDFFD